MLSVGSNLFENINKSSIKKVQEQKYQPFCNLDLKNNANIIPQDADKLFNIFLKKLISLSFIYKLYLYNN